MAFSSSWLSDIYAEGCRRAGGSSIRPRCGAVCSGGLGGAAALRDVTADGLASRLVSGRPSLPGRQPTDATICRSRERSTPAPISRFASTPSLSDQAEKQVPGADVVATLEERLSQREFQDLLGPGRERPGTDRCRSTSGPDIISDVRPHRSGRHADHRRGGIPRCLPVRVGRQT